MALDTVRLARLFKFLEANRSWNQAFQALEFQRTLTCCTRPRERMVSLLHSTVNSQSQPKMHLLGQFWRDLESFQPHGRPTLEELTSYFERSLTKVPGSTGPWDRLFQALAKQNGWGLKTAALFVKNVIQIHRGPAPLHFLKNTKVAEKLVDADRTYLPVDTVIQRIFEALGQPTVDFAAVNKQLLAKYTAEQMLVWDDLWFWGFFTQVTEDKVRRIEWNEDKFWCQIAAPKSQVGDVERLANQFIRICTG